jgi:TPR repeat protein
MMIMDRIAQTNTETDTTGKIPARHSTSQNNASQSNASQNSGFQHHKISANAAIAACAVLFCNVAMSEHNDDGKRSCIGEDIAEDISSHNISEQTLTVDHSLTDVIRRCAKQGDAYAQNTLGTLYRSGTGFKQNEYAARKWYQKAAEQGMADAQYNLGLMYANGDGVTEDYSIAVDWIFRAAQQGHKAAQITFNLMLGDDFTTGC